MSYRKLIVLAAIAAGIGGTVAIAAAPKDTIAARQANFKVLGKGFKGTLDEMRKPAPDIAVFRTNADAMAKAASKVHGYFPKGTGAEAGVKTAALPAIWQKPADFKAALAKLIDATKKYNAAAKSGKIDLVKAAVPGIGASCKGCHDQFKAKDS